jgi:putative redox protein
MAARRNEDSAMAYEPYEFTSPRGYPLSGRLDLPDTPAVGWAVFAHCFTCGKDVLAAARVAQALAQRGIGTLRFDFAGLGASGGDFADTTFAADTADLVAAVRAMSEDDMPPALLVGHSLGGAAALAAAGATPTVRAVATIGAPSNVAHVLHQFDPDSLAEIRAAGQAEVLLGNRRFVVRQSFVDDVLQHDLEAQVAKLHRPLLVLHAPTDATVGVENAARIFTAAKHPKSFVSLDGADHFLSHRADADFAAAMIATWVSRYLPAETTMGGPRPQP